MSARCGYELGFPTPETSQKLFDEMDFQRAVQAYLWAYPAVSFESIRVTLKQDLGLDFNDMGIADKFVGPESVWLTANDTTTYSVVNIDVAQGPVLIDIPPGAIVGLLDDFWQRNLVDVGLPGPDAGNGGKFVLLPPGLRRRGSVRLLRSSGDDAQPQPPCARHHRRQRRARRRRAHPERQGLNSTSG